MKFKAKDLTTCGHWKSQGICSKSRVPALASQTYFAVRSGAWGSHGTPLQVGALRATPAPCCNLTGPVDTIVDKRFSLCWCTSCAHSHWHFQFCRKERISSSYKLLKETLISITLTRACIQQIAWYFVTRLPAKYFFQYWHSLKASIFEHDSASEKWLCDCFTFLTLRMRCDVLFFSCLFYLCFIHEQKYFTVACLHWWASGKMDFFDTESFQNY